MNIFLENHQRLLKALIDAKVDFIVIGGYSVIFHGYGRTTGDMDIWLKPDNDNKARLVNALLQFGISKSSLSNFDSIDFSDRIAFHIDEEPERIDFMTHVNLVAFDEADASKIIADIEGLKIPFLHINHLVLSKMNTGRTKDAADIEELQRIHKYKKQ